MPRTRPHRTRAAAGAVCAAALVAVGQAAAPVRAATLAAPAAPAAMRLTADVLPGLEHLAVVGLPSPGRTLTVAVAVARPDLAGEAALLRAVSDPGSPLYRHYLGVDEMASRFGVAGSLAGRVSAWLRGGGLDLFSVSANRDLYMASGTVAQVDALFRVTERTYRSVQGRVFDANDTAPLVPGGLGITTVVGLNTWQHAATTSHTAHPAPSPTGCTSSCPVEPQQLWSAYDIPAGAHGKGQRIAILGEGVLGSETHSGDVLNDLRIYENERGFPHIPLTVVCVIQGNCGTDTSGAGEWDLDQAATTGMAPYADHLTYYFARDLSDAGQMGMIGAWLSDKQGALQANASFAECEAGPYNGLIYGLPGNVDGGTGVPSPVQGFGPTGVQVGDNLEAYAEPALQGAALTGRTLFASAGDTGTGCDVPVLLGIGPNGLAWSFWPANPYPAGARYAVGVGGTNLTLDGRTPAHRSTEPAWMFTGGGSSLFLTAPDYQQNVPNLNGTCAVSPGGDTSVLGKLCRGTPDIGAMSTGSNSYADVSGGADSSNGGTSLSSPLNAGMWAAVQSAVQLPPGQRLGFANFTYYRLGKNPTTYARDFFDVVGGINGVGCPGTAICQAVKGWDYLTGWGVPDVANVIRDAVPTAPVTTPTPSAAATPTPTPTPAPGGGQPVPGLANTSGAGIPSAAVLIAAAVLVGVLLVGRRRRHRG